MSGDLFAWDSVSPIGMLFEGKVSNSQIKSKLDQGKVVIFNIHKEGHWVLAYGYNGITFWSMILGTKQHHIP